MVLKQNAIYTIVSIFVYLLIILPHSCKPVAARTNIPEIVFTQPTDFNPHSELLMLDRETLALLKQYYRQGDKRLCLSVADLIKKADAALEAGHYSVTYKTGLPPGGDKHDYYSLGVYYWPDPFKVSGLPYIKLDGRINPESYSDKYDKKSIISLFRSVGVLSLAYHYTEKRTYIEHAASLLRVWFLDPKTRMNPHLSFAQIRPGSKTISGSGIIETVGLIDLLDCVTLIHQSGAFSDEEMIGFKKWLADYLEWLFISPQGRQEAGAGNNHGVWYDVQTAAYAVFAGNKELAARILEQRTKKRIAAQIAADGSLPQELGRTRSFHYTLYVLNAFIRAARIGEKAGVDIWHYQVEEGKGIYNALDFIVPYINSTKKWPYQQIRKEDEKSFVPLLVYAAKAYDNVAFRDAARRLLDNDNAHYVNLLIE